MKKLFFLLFVVAMFTACGSDDPVIPDPTPNPNPTPSEWNGDWNNASDPNYKKEGYNPIAGDWIVTKRNGAAVSDFMVYRFAGETNLYLQIATTKPAEGKEPTYGNRTYYTINDKAYKIGKTIYKYTLVSLTSLTIIDGTNTITLVPYNNNDVWYWKGDWNSPKDPHYAIYGGKYYNGILGTWKLETIDGYTSTPSILRYNEDFTMEDIYEPDTKREYQINDTGLKRSSYQYGSVNIAASTWHYWIKDNILYCRGMVDNVPARLFIYTRVK